MSVAAFCGAAEFSSLLARIPLGVRLADPEAGDLIAEDGPAWTLWQGLRDIKPPQGGNRLGRVAAGKLLARKRPHLVPVYDSRVEEILGRAEVHGTWWTDLRCQFTHDQALVDELESVRARAGVHYVSLLRPATACDHGQHGQVLYLCGGPYPGPRSMGGACPRTRVRA